MYRFTELEPAFVGLVPSICIKLGPWEGEWTPTKFSIRLEMGFASTQHGWCHMVRYKGSRPVSTLPDHPCPALRRRDCWNPHNPGPFLPVCSLVTVRNLIRTAPCSWGPTRDARLPPKYAHQTISMIPIALSILSLLQHVLCAHCVPGSLPGAGDPGMEPALVELTVQWGRTKTKFSKVTRIAFIGSWVCDSSPWQAWPGLGAGGGGVRVSSRNDVGAEAERWVSGD